MSFTVLVVVMIALGIGIIGKISGDKRLYCLIGIALSTAKQTDARLYQSHLCTAADAAADQHLYVQS